MGIEKAMDEIKALNLDKEEMIEIANALIVAASKCGPGETLQVSINKFSKEVTIQTVSQNFIN